MSKPRLPGASKAALVVNSGYEDVAVSSITEHPRNPRRGNVEAIKASIRTNGFYGAVAVQRSTFHVLAGNHRFRAARELGMETVPVLWLDVDDARALRILAADNRTSDIAGYDDQALYDMLAEIGTSNPELEGTGFDEKFLENLHKSLGDPTLDFSPVDADAQSRLDERKPTECPNCGHQWVKDS